MRKPSLRHTEGSDAIASRRHLLSTAATQIGLFAGSLRLFELMWHRSALADMTRQPGGWIGAVLVVAASAVVHELLHALAWRTFGRVPWQSLAFRRTWRVMGFVARPDEPVSASAYRAATALPLLVLGFIPIFVGLMTDAGLLVLWGLFFSFESFTDIAALFAMHKVPSDAWVMDHPHKMGCRIVAEETTSAP